MFDNLPATGQLVALRNTEAELVVAPSCGARIVTFRAKGRDILRPTTREALDGAFVYGFAAFPLMPYSGPIFGDGFRFQDEWHPLGRNVPTEPSATHGEAWIRPWSIAARSDAELRLTMEYAPSVDDFPFAWRGDIAYRLERLSLIIDLKVTNRSHRQMPAGLGLHPYFPKAPGMILTFESTGVWPPDAPDAVGKGVAPLEVGLDFRGGQDVSGIVFDRCFEGWDGRASLSAADGWTTRIEADGTFGKLQIYDAWDYPYICVEPVTNANDGFNRAAAGMPGHAVTILESGRSLSGRIIITPSQDGAGSSA